LIEGDDGLSAEKVGEWAKDKHDLLCSYIDITRAARAKYLPPQPGGAAYIDLFCGPGRCFIEDTGEWIDGGAVAAWKASVRGGSPFTRVLIGDADPVRCDAATARLKALGAPVISMLGEAKDTALRVLQEAPPYGLNFAFLDPYSLGVLDFQIISTIARMRRIDMLIHVSTMDLQRNLDVYAQADPSPFDAFAPGWRGRVRTDQSKERLRADMFEYWRTLVAATGVAPSDKVRLITGSKKQRLYWLLLAAKHPLAHKFWQTVVKSEEQGQGNLF
jgi:three-Cys-motif partner protein